MPSGPQVRGAAQPAAAGARQPGQANIRGGMNARPITGQSAAAGQPNRMPQPVPGRPPVAAPAGVPANQANRYKGTIQMRNQPGGQNMVMSQVL